QRPVVAAPGRTVGVLLDVGRGVFQAFEEFLPVGIDGGGVLLVAGVEIVDVGGVCALQKRRESKCSIRVLARHGGFLVIFASRMENGALAGPNARTGRVMKLYPILGGIFCPKITMSEFIFNFL